MHTDRGVAQGKIKLNVTLAFMPSTLWLYFRPKLTSYRNNCVTCIDFRIFQVKHVILSHELRIDFVLETKSKSFITNI